MKSVCKMQSPAHSGGVRAGSRFAIMAAGLCLWLFAGAQDVLSAEPQVPKEVLSAATNGLPVFLAHVPPQEKGLYGFAKEDDPARCHLGTPLLQHTITPASLKKAAPNAAVSSVSSDTTMWFFPVMLGSQTKALLVVDRMDTGWKAVSMGYAELARELERHSKPVA